MVADGGLVKPDKFNKSDEENIDKREKRATEKRKKNGVILKATSKFVKACAQPRQSESGVKNKLSFCTSFESQVVSGSQTDEMQYAVAKADKP